MSDWADEVAARIKEFPTAHVVAIELRKTRAAALREAAAYIDRVESHLRGYMSGEALLATFHIPKDTA